MEVPIAREARTGFEAEGYMTGDLKLTGQFIQRSRPRNRPDPSGWYILGEEVAAFEKLLPRAKVHLKGSNCTSAAHRRSCRC